MLDQTVQHWWLKKNTQKKNEKKKTDLRAIKFGRKISFIIKVEKISSF